MYPPLSNTTFDILAALALLAIKLPTSLAASLFAFFVLTSLSKVEAETKVFPATSSITCA